jgi:GDPmannose 4,6-dehydratase
MVHETDHLRHIDENRAFVLGAGGQDGSLLTEYLLDRGYSVTGVVRSGSTPQNLSAVATRVDLVEVDVLDSDALAVAVEAARPREVYNLASPSFVPASWNDPVGTAELAAVGVTALLEAIRCVDPSIRFYQASSSEIFGEPNVSPQNEDTPLAPLSPYGVAKAYAHFITRSYRRRYELFACSGILYNHESERRPPSFLPSKVARGAAAISLGIETHLRLGDLSARRDWGYARDYVDAMWRMLQCDEPDDYVVATGEVHTVEELVCCAFERVGLDWRAHVVTDPALFRGRAEVHGLVGDASRARERLGWSPTLRFEELIHLLVDSEVARLRVRSPEDAATLGTGAQGSA